MRSRERIKFDPFVTGDMLNANLKVKKAARMLRQYTSRETQERARCAARDALDTLWAIVRSPISADQAKIAAAGIIFDRAYGRATQVAVTANVSDNAAPKDLNRTSLEQRIKETLSRIDGVESGETEAGSGQDGPPHLREFH